jgi:hypothetical protein
LSSLCYAVVGFTCVPLRLLFEQTFNECATLCIQQQQTQHTSQHCKDKSTVYSMLYTYKSTPVSNGGNSDLHLCVAKLEKREKLCVHRSVPMCLRALNISMPNCSTSITISLLSLSLCCCACMHYHCLLLGYTSRNIAWEKQRAFTTTMELYSFGCAAAAAADTATTAAAIACSTRLKCTHTSVVGVLKRQEIAL